ncbi:hypothetical protein ACFQO4_03140 [Saliphagus sp. GCM10025334]
MPENELGSDLFSLFDGPIGDDVFFELMKNPQRRFIFQYLLEKKETTLVALAREISAHEHGYQVDDLEEGDWKRAYVALEQTHLPKMDDVDLLDYEPDQGVICLAENSERMKDELNRDDIVGSENRLR